MPLTPPDFRDYMGDGVYVRWDGMHIVLTTENGISVSNRICLDAATLLSFEVYTKQLREILAYVPPPEETPPDEP